MRLFGKPFPFLLYSNHFPQHRRFIKGDLMPDELQYIITHPMLIWGAIGAATVWALHLIVMGRRGKKPGSPGYYLFLTTLYVAVGAVLAVVFDASNRAIAFYLGASWPANLGFYAGAPPPNPGEPNEKLSLRQMMGFVFYRHYYD